MGLFYTCLFTKKKKRDFFFVFFFARQIEDTIMIPELAQVSETLLRLDNQLHTKLDNLGTSNSCTDIKDLLGLVNQVKIAVDSLTHTHGALIRSMLLEQERCYYRNPNGNLAGVPSNHPDSILARQHGLSHFPTYADRAYVKRNNIDATAL